MKTLFFLRPLARELMDSHRLITAPSEPNARPAPFFVLIRGASSVIWGVRKDVPEEIANEFDRLASEEPPIRDFRAPPLHADAYQSLAGGQIVSGPSASIP